MDTATREQHPNGSLGEHGWGKDDAERRRDRPTRPVGDNGWGVNRTRTPGWPDREIGAIAARQRALVTRAQLVALGVGPRAIVRGIARGRLHCVHRGVYSLLAPNARPPFASEQAAILAVGERAYVSHDSAAALWAIRPPTDGDVDVTVVGRDAGRSRTGVRIHRARTMHPRDTRVLQSILVTSPARTVLDIAPSLSDRELEKTFDDAITRDLMTLAAVEAMLSANSGRPGSSRLRELAHADRTTAMTRSEAEERFLELVRKAGLPQPGVNVRIGRWTVDFLWRSERLVVEIDGHRFHSSRAARERDHRKDAELQHAGLLVIRVSARRLTHVPEEVIAQVAGALATRGVAGALATRSVAGALATRGLTSARE